MFSMQKYQRDCGPHYTDFQNEQKSSGLWKGPVESPIQMNERHQKAGKGQLCRVPATPHSLSNGQATQSWQTMLFVLL